jgi:predicted transcriptional regulator
VDSIALILVGALAAATVGAAVEYYRQLRKVQKEYEKARGSVEDVVLSFNRQLRREAEKTELVAYKVESNLSKGDRALSLAEESAKSVDAMETKIVAVSEEKEQMVTRISEIDKRVQEAVASHETLGARISNLEEKARQVPALLEPNIEAVIPIRREKALALTDTELAALELLAQEGPKTAPEIKERVRLSREHTARLMKKLYEEGYLERDTNKIPFKYSVKKEMEKFLKKTESNAA